MYWLDNIHVIYHRFQGMVLELVLGSLFWSPVDILGFQLDLKGVVPFVCLFVQVVRRGTVLLN